MPPPVFFCSIEAEQSKDKQELQKILFNLSREDPSIHIKEDEETGQLLVSGLGELHLEVLRDRIEIEYNIKAELESQQLAERQKAKKGVVYGGITESKRSQVPSSPGSSRLSGFGTARPGSAASKRSEEARPPRWQQ